MGNLTDRAADRPIAVGDLVITVDGYGDFSNYIGRIGKVLSLCDCGCRRPDAWKLPFGPGGWATKHLKRIPPLDELESTRTDEPIQEPA